MHFGTLVFERSRLPLLLIEATCEERHFRKIPSRLSTIWSVEKARRAHKENCNVKLRDMNVPVSATDERDIEVVAACLPTHHGAQLVTGHHTPERSHFGALRTTATTVNWDKEAKFAKLPASERCRLVVVAMETGREVEHGGFGVRGRRGTSSGKGRPPALRRSAFLAWRKRWTRMLSVSCVCWSRVSLTLGQELMGRRPISPICTGRGDVFCAVC